MEDILSRFTSWTMKQVVPTHMDREGDVVETTEPVSATPTTHERLHS